MYIKKFAKTFLILIVLTIMCISTNALAVGNCAFSVGGGFSDLNVDGAVRQAQVRYKNMGYSSYYANKPTASEFSGYFQNGTRRLESDIVFMAGHGDYGTIEVTPGVGLTATSYSNFLRTSNVNWSKTKLVTVMSCNSGAETNTSIINLAYNIWVKSGYKNSTLGWRNTIYDVDITKWSDRFNYKLQNGANIRNAIDYANGFAYHSDSIKDLAFYGTWSDTINSTSSVTKNIIKEETDRNIINIYEKNIEYNGTIENIVETIEKLYGKINLKNYEVKTFKLDNTNKNFTIDFKYKVDGFYTDEGYVVSIVDGKIKSITNNMIKDDNNEKDSTRTSLSLDELNHKIESLKQDSIDKIKATFIESNENKIQITKQECKKHIDRKTNQKSIIVLTEYTLNGKTIAGVSKQYEI